ncbi:MAG: SIS domain-containing protein [Bacteroidia bacterium]|nr:SIS domain-containing protein [Bacteroidia bacterium]
MEIKQFTGVSSKYLRRLNDVFNSIDKRCIDNGVELVSHAWKNGKQIFTLGNGGSSLTAIHFIADWNKSVFLKGKLPFRGYCLVENIGLVMAYANDMSFQDIFIEQLKNRLERDDLVIAISGSGNSENVLRAIEYSNQIGAVTLGLCGFDGGKLKQIAQHHVWANVNDMQLTEDVHAIFGHIVMQSLCGYHLEI